jgi:DNA repair protein RadA/Sms
MKLNVSLNDWKNGTNILSLEVPAQLKTTIQTGIDFVDYGLGGQGVTPSSAVLVTGTPGAGKSTMCLQLADSCTKQGHSVLFNTGEESLFQVKKVCDRLKLNHGFYAGQSTKLSDIIKHARELKSKEPQKQQFLIIDSLQTIDDEYYANGLINSMTQVRVAEKLTEYCKETFAIALIIGQVTKEGEFSGKQAIKHAVDVHMHLSIDLAKKSETYGERVLEIQKNRFGPAGKRFLVNLTESGISLKDEITAG